MGQLLRIIIVVFVVWLVITLIKRALAPPQAPKPKTPGVAQMVQCAHCGVHLPMTNAIQDGNQYYCCPDHKKAP